MDDSPLSTAPSYPAGDESVVSPKQPAPLTQCQGIAIIVLLGAILVVGIVIIVLLVRRKAARTYLDRLRDSLVGRAHQAARLSSKEMDLLLAKKEALRLEAWEARLAELLERPRALAGRFERAA